MPPEVDRQHYGITFSLLALAAASFSLMQSLVAPALLEIQHDLGTSTTGATWILTAYLLSASVCTPILGRLGDMFGKRRVLILVLAALSLGTLVSALATSIGVMVAGRVIQGIGGAMFPLAYGIIRDEFPKERVSTGIALISAMLGIGGGAGIVLAGPIVEHLSYHYLFWLPLLVIGIATIGSIFLIPESPVRTPGRVNWAGAVLLAAWLSAFLVGVSQGSSWGWGSAARARPLRARARPPRRLDPERGRRAGAARRHADAAGSAPCGRRTRPRS